MGTHKEGNYHLSANSIENIENYQLGCGGLQEQITFQGLDPQCMLLVISYLYLTLIRLAQRLLPKSRSSLIK